VPAVTHTDRRAVHELHGAMASAWDGVRHTRIIPISISSHSFQILHVARRIGE
jgi:hypothetical protein